MRRFVMIILVLLLFAGTALGDVIYLKNGREIRGKIIEQDKETVTIEVPYGQMTFKKKNIDRIEKESEKK